MVVVCKFGGSSLADADSVERVCEILRESEQRRYAVVSAMGSVCVGQKKITDLFIELAEGGADAEAEIRRRHTELAEQLGYSGIKVLLDEVFDSIHCKNNKDFTVSRGEYLMARIVSKKLGRQFVDGSEIIAFKGNRWDVGGSVLKAKEKLENLDSAVIAGFYGADEKGDIHTLTRGGSDITGAVVANAVDADLYENWTDVDGFFAVDPRYSESKLMDCLSYDELTLLSYYGARVLHYKTVVPLVLKAIPLNIRNTFNTGAKGTMVSYERRKGFKGVAVSDFKMYEIEGMSGDEIGEIGSVKGKIFSGINRAVLLTDDDGFFNKLKQSGKVTRIRIRDVSVAAVAGCDSASGAEVITELRKQGVSLYAVECVDETFIAVTDRKNKERIAEIVFRVLGVK